MNGMATRKTTLTLPEEALAAARQAVRERRARSVSAWFAEAAAAKMRRDPLLDVVEDMSAEAGEPTEEERAWAERAWALAEDTAAHGHRGQTL